MEPAAGIINTCPNVLQGVSAHMFLTLINSLMASQCWLGSEGKYPPDYGPQLKDGDEFDFIIVGAGSAGSVLANRLTEVAEWKVLLLEAGSYPSGMSEIPALLFSLQDTEEDWQYEMESSKTFCLNQKNKRCRCPRGKGLGGSSLINAMIYVRSTKHDHDEWVANGNEEWDYDTAVKYYNKIENVHVEDITNNEAGGELHLTRYTNTEPIRKILQESYEELGYQYYTDDNPIGFMDTLTSIYQGTRQNMAKAFLSSIKERKNLYLATGAHVNRLVVDTDDQLTVQGVQLRINNQIIAVKAKNEVILSAGSINSPQILMNSGIGPKEHLSQMGIKVLKDLSVGDNFQDHVTLVLAIGFDQSALTSQTQQHALNQLYDYFIHRKGDFSKIDLTNFVNFVNTENKTSFANMQITPVLIKQQEPYLLHEVIRCMGIPDDAAKNIIAYNQNSPLLILITVLLHPKSRGSVQLQDSEPFSNPLILPNFLSDKHENDIQILLDGIKIIQKVIATNAFAPYHPKLIDLMTKNCNQEEFNSDAYWKCVIKNNLSTLFHPVGTCKMGPASDPTAVVNPRLNIHGVRGVRVIDGSILPTITSGNTNAPIIMVAERGADLIKEDWLRHVHNEL